MGYCAPTQVAFLWAPEAGTPKVVIAMKAVTESGVAIVVAIVSAAQFDVVAAAAQWVKLDFDSVRDYPNTMG